MITNVAISVTAPRPTAGGVHQSALGSGSGMTLVELMVALVIITILSSLSLAGLAVARTTAKKAKTAATIRKISEIILPYYEEYETRRPSLKVLRKTAAETVWVDVGLTALTSLPNGRSYLTTAKQTAIRRLMALELPERITDFTDALKQSGATLKQDDTTDFVEYPMTSATLRIQFTDMPPSARRFYDLTKPSRDNPDKTKAPTSSDLLHLIVTRGPVADPDIVSHFRDDEVRDTNANGLLEFVDGWNRPIAFRRWPIGFMSPVQTIDNHNIDPVFSSRGHRLVPLIFSAGPDGVYDIVSDIPDASGKPLSYHDPRLKYDPFNIDPTAPAQPPLGLPLQSPVPNGSVVLWPTPSSSSSPLTFSALRVRAGASLEPKAFQTIGSERDVGSSDNEASPNGVVESIDNIHNHDMSR